MQCFQQGDVFDSFIPKYNLNKFWRWSLYVGLQAIHIYSNCSTISDSLTRNEAQSDKYKKLYQNNIVKVVPIGMSLYK